MTGAVSVDTVPPDTMCAAFRRTVAAAAGHPAGHPAVREAVAAGVSGATATPRGPKQIKRYDLLADVWQPGGDLVTPTMKVRGRAVLEAYADRVEARYSPGAR
jgi:long-chain acyl-CoA synthetase